jgi:protein-S-isoprenylcysteine O-methyltransferase Ste14
VRHPWLYGAAVAIAGGGMFALMAMPAHSNRTSQTSDDPAGKPIGDSPVALAVGETVATAEKAALDLGTNRVYRFRLRHPFLYGLAALIAGAGVVAAFILLSFLRTTYESPDLKAALYSLIIGGTGGGIAGVALAFAYTGAIRRTLGPMQAAGVIGSAEPATARLRPAE